MAMTEPRRRAAWAPLMPRNRTMRRAKTLDIVPRERAMRFFSKPSRIRSVLRLDLSLSPH